MGNTVVITSQEVVQAHAPRTITLADGGTLIDDGTQYIITGTINGAGPFTVCIWTEVYTQTQAAGYTGPTWAQIVAGALVAAADPPSQTLGGASLVNQTITA